MIEQKRAAIYCRVSTPEQEAEGSSLATQEAACRKYAADHGYTVDERHVFVEVHSGAELWERAALTRMRAAMARQEFAAIVAYAVDRLAREQNHLGLILSEGERWRVGFEFVTEKLDDTPIGKHIRSTLALVAEIEREKIRERSLRGKRARVDAGKLPNFGADIYGYRRDRERGVRTVHEAEAAIVRQVFAWVAEEAVSLRQVIRRLNAASVPSPAVGRRTFKDGRTPQWGKSMLRRLLTDPAYKGETVVWRLRKIKAKDLDKDDPRKGLACGYVIRARPENERVTLPEGTTPAIVPAAVWDEAQRVLVANVGDSARNEVRPYMLRGRVVCCVCGRKMRSCPEHDRRVYRCSSRETPAGPCGAKRVRAEELEAWAWGKIAAALDDPSIITREVERMRAAGPDASLASGLETARRLLAKIEKQQERLLHSYRTAEDDASFPWELVQREMAKAEQEKTAARATIADLERRLAQQHAAVEQMEALETYCTRWARRLGSAGFAEKRLALEALSIEVLAGGPPEEWQIRGNMRIAGDEDTTQRDCAPQRQLPPALASRAPDP